MNVIKKINVDGIEYDIQSKELTKVSYAELKAMRDNGELVEGHLYRITDYEFTTTQSKTESAGHVFDIIVLATSASELSHIARAIAHEGDTYFDGNDLGAWELWYVLDNDEEKYEWADAENGKGVIYRMIDEKRNDCPYDFKNALFYNDKLTTNTTPDKYYYTFSYVVEGVLYDGTVEKQVKNCYGNSMGVRIKTSKKSLNSNVFRNTTFGSYCNSNTFGNNCYSNTFGNDCGSNTFGSYCYSNTFGDHCDSNTFGNNCYSNTFGNNCYSNTFGNNCYSNTFGNNCNSNTFGSYCNSNTFGYNCYSNTFGSYCYSNTFGDNCYSNTFGSYCNSNTFGDNCYSNTFGDHLSLHEVNSERTSLTRNEEYYDDGSGQLVPVKHPDLATQPNILPYKFAGQYVYEQLIFLGKSKDASISTDALFMDIARPLGIANPLVLKVEGFAYGRAAYHEADGNVFEGNRVHGMPVDTSIKFNITGDSEADMLRFGLYATRPTGYSFGTSPDVELSFYARIIFTSVPDEGGYYGYNEY